MCFSTISRIVHRQANTPPPPPSSPPSSIPSLDDLASDEWCTLLIVQQAMRSAALVQAISAPQDPECAQDGKHQAGNGDESASTGLPLLIPDTEQGPRNRSSTSKVTLGRREGVGGSGGLKDEEGEEHKDLGPHTSVVLVGITAKGFKASEEDEDSGPAVVQGEGKVNKHFVSESARPVVLLDDIVNMADGRADEQGEDECNYVVVVSPDVDIDGIEDRQERETPSNAVNGDLLASVGELVDDITEQQEVDERPDDKGPACRGEIRLLGGLVNVTGTRNSINVAAEEEEVDDNVDNLQKDAIFPRASCGVVRHVEFV